MMGNEQQSILLLKAIRDTDYSGIENPVYMLMYGIR